MSTTQEIGQRAVDLVKEYEEKQGRKVKKARPGSGYDLISEGEGEDTRIIEVKAEKGSQVAETHSYALTLKEWEVFSTDEHAWLYIVYSLHEHPKLVKLQKDQIKLHQIKIIAPQVNIRFCKDDRKLKNEDLH